jgi:hypothetical protein
MKKLEERDRGRESRLFAFAACEKENLVLFQVSSICENNIVSIDANDSVLLTG